MNDKERLIKLIEEKKKKVDILNKFEKNMHFLNDFQEVEVYQLIHKEERELALLVAKFEEKFAGPVEEKAL